METTLETENKNADKNFIFFKNIYFKPATNKSKLFLINLSTNKIINEVEIKQNFLNEIEIKNKYISEYPAFIHAYVKSMTDLNPTLEEVKL